jgi:hypothetical protein
VVEPYNSGSRVPSKFKLGPLSNKTVDMVMEA